MFNGLNSNTGVRTSNATDTSEKIHNKDLECLQEQINQNRCDIASVSDCLDSYKSEPNLAKCTITSCNLYVENAQIDKAVLPEIDSDLTVGGNIVADDITSNGTLYACSFSVENICVCNADVSEINADMATICHATIDDVSITGGDAVLTTIESQDANLQNISSSVLSSASVTSKSIETKSLESESADISAITSESISTAGLSADNAHLENTLSHFEKFEGKATNGVIDFTETTNADWYRYTMPFDYKGRATFHTDEWTIHIDTTCGGNTLFAYSERNMDYLKDVYLDLRTCRLAFEFYCYAPICYSYIASTPDSYCFIDNSLLTCESASSVVYPECKVTYSIEESRKRNHYVLLGSESNEAGMVICGSFDATYINIGSPELSGCVAINGDLYVSGTTNLCGCVSIGNCGMPANICQFGNLTNCEIITDCLTVNCCSTLGTVKAYTKPAVKEDGIEITQDFIDEKGLSPSQYLEEDGKFYTIESMASTNTINGENTYNGTNTFNGTQYINGFNEVHGDTVVEDDCTITIRNGDCTHTNVLTSESIDINNPECNVYIDTSVIAICNCDGCLTQIGASNIVSCGENNQLLMDDCNGVCTSITAHEIRTPSIDVADGCAHIDDSTMCVNMDTCIVGKLCIEGDIIQHGDAYETHAEKLYTKCDCIFLRDCAECGLGPTECAGLVVKCYNDTSDLNLLSDNKGTFRIGENGTHYGLVDKEKGIDQADKYYTYNDTTGEYEEVVPTPDEFDPDITYYKIQQSMQPLLTRGESEDMCNGMFLKWCASEQCAYTDSGLGGGSKPKVTVCCESEVLCESSLPVLRISNRPYQCTGTKYGINCSGLYMTLEDKDGNELVRDWCFGTRTITPISSAKTVCWHTNKNGEIDYGAWGVPISVSGGGCSNGYQACGYGSVVFDNGCGGGYTPGNNGYFSSNQTYTPSGYPCYVMNDHCLVCNYHVEYIAPIGSAGAATALTESITQCPIYGPQNEGTQNGYEGTCNGRYFYPIIIGYNSSYFNYVNNCGQCYAAMNNNQIHANGYAVDNHCSDYLEQVNGFAIWPYLSGEMSDWKLNYFGSIDCTKQFNGTQCEWMYSHNGFPYSGDTNLTCNSRTVCWTDAYGREWNNCCFIDFSWNNAPFSCNSYQYTDYDGFKRILSRRIRLGCNINSINALCGDKDSISICDCWDTYIKCYLTKWGNPMDAHDCRTKSMYGICTGGWSNLNWTYKDGFTQGLPFWYNTSYCVYYNRLQNDPSYLTRASDPTDVQVGCGQVVAMARGSLFVCDDVASCFSGTAVSASVVESCYNSGVRVPGWYCVNKRYWCQSRPFTAVSNFDRPDYVWSDDLMCTLIPTCYNYSSYCCIAWDMSCCLYNKDGTEVNPSQGLCWSTNYYDINGCCVFRTPDRYMFVRYENCGLFSTTSTFTKGCKYLNLNTWDCVTIPNSPTPPTTWNPPTSDMIETYGAIWNAMGPYQVANPYHETDEYGRLKMNCVYLMCPATTFAKAINMGKCDPDGCNIKYYNTNSYFKLPRKAVQLKDSNCYIVCVCDLGQPEFVLDNWSAYSQIANDVSCCFELNHQYTSIQLTSPIGCYVAPYTMYYAESDCLCSGDYSAGHWSCTNYLMGAVPGSNTALYSKKRESSRYTGYNDNKNGLSYCVKEYFKVIFKSSCTLNLQYWSYNDSGVLTCLTSTCTADCFNPIWRVCGSETWAFDPKVRYYQYLGNCLAVVGNTYCINPNCTVYTCCKDFFGNERYTSDIYKFNQCVTVPICQSTDGCYVYASDINCCGMQIVRDTPIFPTGQTITCCFENGCYAVCQTWVVTNTITNNICRQQLCFLQTCSYKNITNLPGEAGCTIRVYEPVHIIDVTRDDQSQQHCDTCWCDWEITTRHVCSCYVCVDSNNNLVISSCPMYIGCAVETRSPVKRTKNGVTVVETARNTVTSTYYVNANCVCTTFTPSFDYMIGVEPDKVYNSEVECGSDYVTTIDCVDTETYCYGCFNTYSDLPQLSASCQIAQPIDYYLCDGQYSCVREITTTTCCTEGVNISEIMGDMCIGGSIKVDGNLCVAGSISGSIEYPIGWVLTIYGDWNPNGILKGYWVKFAEDRFLVGAGNCYCSGETGGCAEVSLDASQIAPHSHRAQGWNIGICGGPYACWLTATIGPRNSNNGNLTASGSGCAHENRPPYIGVNFWVREA